MSLGAKHCAKTSYFHIYILHIVFHNFKIRRIQILLIFPELMIQKYTKISLCGQHLTVNLFKYFNQELYGHNDVFKVTQDHLHFDLTVLYLIIKSVDTF